MSADAHRRSHILDWLCSDDYSTQFETRRAKHLRGTGQWFLEDSTFLNWVQVDRSSTLMCPGGPGCGKTTISTLVIDHLRSASGLRKPVIHFFFDYQRQEEQTVDDFVATLLRQLASLSQEVFSAVEKFHNRFVFQNRRPSLDDLQSELRSAFQAITGVFVVIDAWDECESVKRTECANMLHGCLSQCVVHLLATTRDDHEVQALLDRDLALRIRASTEDLTLYAKTRAVELAPNIRDDEGLVGNVIEGLIDASDGVFLLARLHMNSMQDHLTANEVKETLTGLRKDVGSYSSAYKAIMERISGQKRRSGLAMRILAWVVHSKRPLSFGELNHALATRPGKRSIDGDDTYAKDVILSVCAGLITLDDTYGTPVRLIHYTAQEYLFDTWMQWFPTESADIVDVCLTYLSFDEFKYPCLDWQTLSSRHYHYTLFEYAAQNWAYHFKDKKIRRKGDCTTTRMALGFLLDRFSVCSAVQALDRESPDGYDLMCHGIHLAAYLGLEDLTMLLIAAMRVEPYLEDIGLRTPLWWAARQGHADVVRALLGTKRVNVNRKDYYRGEWPYTYGQTPLAAAAGNGHEEVVKVLLATERTVFDTRDLQGRSPLSYAAENGHKNIVKILLDTGVFNINETNDWRSWTPLSCAAANGHEGVIRMLLAVQGIDVNLKDRFGQSPLSSAAMEGHGGVVKTLLEIDGVDVNSKDRSGQTSLSHAAENAHRGVIKMLLATERVEVDSKDLYDKTPLSYAAKKGHKEVVEALLATNRVNINSRNRDGQTPLFLAAENGQTGVIKTLLAIEKVDVNLRDPDGLTPLSSAAKQGHEGVVRLLLATKNIDLNPKDFEGRTALGWAIEKRYDNIAALLMAAEADTTPEDHDGAPELDNEQGKREQQSSERENKQTSKKQKLLTDDR
ncbi:hypothetical protein D6C94_06659 [Aureobasidium pullulans]|uniref:NACHT domain-containing protein n=1 Tax=Aureobasidium pullulans TaxID=5580 RepID=A0AB38LT59_AURPU|nr:hypothetical protein D6C94_06659 [Aureobasidium pullulans]